MQTVVEGQRMLADAMRQLANREAHHGRQGPEPNQYSDFKDFLDTNPLLFKEAEESVAESPNLMPSQEYSSSIRP
jgi:hypothetical protein